MLRSRNDKIKTEILRTAVTTAITGYGAGQMSSLLEDIEERLGDAKESGEDLSADYHGKDGSPGYLAQEQVRLQTRLLLDSFLSEYSPEGGNRPVSDKITRGVLSCLETGRTLFGEHPFHHVMEGRLATVVQLALQQGGTVDEEFRQRYESFKIQAHNNPGLNYNTPRNLPKQFVPPDWKAAE